MANFKEIKDRIALILAADDITDGIDGELGFVNTAIRKIESVPSQFQYMRVEEEAVSISSGSDACYSPERCQVIEDFYIEVGGVRYTLNQVTSQTMRGFNTTGSTAQGLPRYFAVKGKTVDDSSIIQLYPEPDSDHTGYMSFFQRSPVLVASTDENWLTVNYPDLVIYGALLEAEPFIYNDERGKTWMPKYAQLLDSLLMAEGAAVISKNGNQRFVRC